MILQAIANLEKAHLESITKLEKEHAEELAEVMERSQQEKEDSLTMMKSSITAEKQVMFNEALNKAVSDKEKIIEDLRKREGQMKEEIDKQRGEFSEGN